MLILIASILLIMAIISPISIYFIIEYIMDNKKQKILNSHLKNLKDDTSHFINKLSLKERAELFNSFMNFKNKCLNENLTQAYHIYYVNTYPFKEEPYIFFYKNNKCYLGLSKHIYNDINIKTAISILNDKNGFITCLDEEIIEELFNETQEMLRIQIDSEFINEKMKEKNTTYSKNAYYNS